MVEDLIDSRREEPSFILSERQMAEAWLDFHRVTLLLKCEGLRDDERKARPVSTSGLSLHGLVRHMAEVERNWFRRVLIPDPDAPSSGSIPPSPIPSCIHSTKPTGSPISPRGRSSVKRVGRRPPVSTWTTPADGTVSPARCDGSTPTWSRSMRATTVTPTSSENSSMDRSVGNREGVSYHRLGEPYSEATRPLGIRQCQTVCFAETRGFVA
jgi:hypothetical protein